MTSDRLTLIRALVGTAYGPRHRNCYWLACEVQRKAFGRDLPLADRRLVLDERVRSAAIAAHPARVLWPEVPEPIDGALVLMGRTGLPDIHCGVYLADLVAVLHTDEPHGVTYDTIPDLKLRWSRIRFHAPA